MSVLLIITTIVGVFYMVKVTVSSGAERASIGISTVDAHVVDAANNTYSRDTDAEGPGIDRLVEWVLVENCIGHKRTYFSLDDGVAVASDQRRDETV